MNYAITYFTISAMFLFAYLFFVGFTMKDIDTEQGLLSVIIFFLWPLYLPLLLGAVTKYIWRNL